VGGWVGRNVDDEGGGAAQRGRFGPHPSRSHCLHPSPPTFGFTQPQTPPKSQVLEFKARQLEAHPEVKPVCRRVAIAADMVTDAWEEKLATEGQRDRREIKRAWVGVGGHRLIWPWLAMTDRTNRPRSITATNGTGFRRDQPSVWIAEGLLPYLPHDVARALLQRVAAVAAPGSFFGADAFNSALIRLSGAQGMTTSLAEGGAAIVFGPDDPEAFLRESGWSAPCVWQHGAFGAHFGRWPFPLPPPRWVDWLVRIPRFWLLTATVPAREEGS
jgi:hypothetical protein